jgi:hypothetical protein
MIGNHSRALGMLPEAQRQPAESLRIGRQACTGDDESPASSLQKLALVNSELGRYADTGVLVREARDMRRRPFAERHADALKRMNHLAQTRFDRGDWVGAQSLHRRTPAPRREPLGDTHTNVANSLNDLAIVVLSQGNLTEAESLYRESLGLDRAYHGEGHPQASVSMSNLADIRNGRPEPHRAEAQFAAAAAVDGARRVGAVQCTGDGVGRAVTDRTAPLACRA